MAENNLTRGSSDGYEGIERVARHLFECGFFKDLRSISQAFVKIIKGRALGIDEFTACDQINIIQGKPAPNANLIAALIRKSERYDYEVLELSPTVCTIQITKDGKPQIPTTFTMVQAKAAGLTRNATYNAYPTNMLFARCISNAGKFHCPDICTGLYVPEDFGEDGSSFAIDITPSNPSPVALLTQKDATPIVAVPMKDSFSAQELMDATKTSLEDLNYALGTEFKSVEDASASPYAMSFLKSKKEALS